MRLALLLALASLALPATALAGTPPLVAAFYYPWFGNPETGGYAHWAQDGHAPPEDIASDYYPVEGPYSSSNAAVIATQMEEVQDAGINELVVSWWGRGSPEDQVLPDVIAGAVPYGIQIAAHIEPYAGRTAQSVLADATYLHSLGIDTIFVYQPFANDQPADWAPVNDALHALGMTTFAETPLVGQAVTGHFNGVYTYDILTYGARFFARYCSEAHKVGLICAPSVGPGFDAQRATGNPNVKPRRNGATYDAMWLAAIAGGADEITVTSFNEWQEGTQIEPAIGVTLGSYHYDSYNGAWGLEGIAAENAYIDRTAYWSNLFRKARDKPNP